MSMMEEPPRDERRGVVVQMWLVSLGIAVFCCAIFSALVASYVGHLSETLNSIDTRLANMETRPTPPLGAMVAPPPAAAPVVAPVVDTPAAPTPAPSPAAETAPAPVPEMAAPTVAPPGSPAAEIPSAAPAATGAPEPITAPAPTPAATTP